VRHRPRLHLVPSSLSSLRSEWVAHPLYNSQLPVNVHTQDSIINEAGYVGLACADVCRTLDRGTNGRRVDEFNQSVFEAIGQLTT